MDTMEQRVTTLEREFNKHLMIQKQSREKMEKVVDNLATKEDLKALSDSIEGVANLIENFEVGVHIGGNIIRFSGKFIIGFGGFVVALAAVTGFLKVAFMYLGLGWLVDFFHNVKS